MFEKSVKHRANDASNDVIAHPYLEKLPKLEATIQETVRLNPNGPMIPRATAHATRVRDYVVPANCQVWINAYHINYDPTIFPDPTTFSPHRWLRPDGTFRRE